MRSRLVLVGMLAAALASCATLPTPQDAYDVVVIFREYGA